MDMELSDEETGQNGNSSYTNLHEKVVDDSVTAVTSVTFGQEKSESHKTSIIQVLNVSPDVSLEQFKTLFSYLGDISNIQFFQPSQTTENNSKVCFVEFTSSSSAFMAQHLTNTVFIDRALIVIPYEKLVFPDRNEALASIAGVSELLANYDCDTSQARDRTSQQNRSRERASQRSRSRDKVSKRSRSRERVHRRSRSRDRVSQRSRSRDRVPHRSRSKERVSRRSRSRSRDRDRGRDYRRRSRSRERMFRRSSRSRDRVSRRSRSKDREYRRRSRSRESKKSSRAKSNERNKTKRHRSRR